MINSLKKTLLVIKKNKSKVFLIFFLQIIFFITLSMIFYQQIIPAMHHAKNAVDYYDNIDTVENPGMFAYLGDDPLTIYENYTLMMRYLKSMVLYSILAFIIINGLIWSFSDNLISKKTTKQFFTYLFNFAIITLSFTFLFYVLVFSTLKSSLVKLEYTFLPLVGALFLSGLLMYFIVISFSLIDKRKIKDILKLIFPVGFFKFFKIIFIYLFNLLIISFFSYLIYLTIEYNIVILSIVLILFVFGFVFTRLFLIVAINSLVQKK